MIKYIDITLTQLMRLTRTSDSVGRKPLAKCSVSKRYYLDWRNPLFFSVSYVIHVLLNFFILSFNVLLLKCFLLILIDYESKWYQLNLAELLTMAEFLMISCEI